MKTHRPDSLLQYPTEPDSGLSEPVDEERFRGHGGGLIGQHRALNLEPHNRRGLLGDALLAVALAELWWLSLGWVAGTWARGLDFLRQVFGLEGYVVVVDYSWGLRVPYLMVESSLPSFGTWVGGAVLTVVLLVASFLLPRRVLPIAYMLRIIAGFQLVAQVFFAFWPEAFPYDTSGYVHGMLITGVGFVALTPLLLGLAYFVFDFGFWRKLGLALLVMLFFSVFFPMQYMAHALALHHLSLLYLPLLFFVFGLPLDVVLFIALYGWGVSWKSRWYAREVGAEPRWMRQAKGVA